MHAMWLDRRGAACLHIGSSVFHTLEHHETLSEHWVGMWALLLPYWVWISHACLSFVDSHDRHALVMV